MPQDHTQVVWPPRDRGIGDLFLFCVYLSLITNLYKCYIQKTVVNNRKFPMYAESTVYRFTPCSWSV